MTRDEIDARIRAAREARRTQRSEQAVDLLHAVLRADPDAVEALVLLGNALADLKNPAEAIAAFDRAIALDPGHAPAFVGRGLAKLRAGSLPAAMADAARATVLQPDLAAAWVALGRIFSKLGFSDLAAKAFRTAMALAPDLPMLRGLLLQEQLAGCDWAGLDALVAEIEQQIANDHPAVSPFYWHVMSSSPQSQLHVARQASAAHPFAPVPARPRPSADAARIRLGYVSGELNLSPNGLCMAGVFEAHDKRGIDLIGFDNGTDDGTPLRRRIVAAFDELVPVAGLSDRQLAAAVADRGIDVLVNLNGFFGNERSAAFRFKPAPVQVSYLGCPGTMGAPYMDYIVADATVIPAGDEGFYDEKIVRLPDTYYPTDRARPISPHTVSRADCGLPAEAFVFCCFNVGHKILPGTFAGWMRILHRVPGSVLWLIHAPPAAAKNLRAEAAVRGVDPARLIFAPYVSPEDHLARHRCADLFLDTLPYNAHTTAIDALWSGLPVLTCRGPTFPGRVAASILAAIDMAELVTETPDAYERRAVELATDPAELQRLRARLDENRLTTPLFDTAAFTRHLDTAYHKMVDRHRRGLPPAGFDVASSRNSISTAAV